MICLTDSSAAKGIASRKGVGKVKHLSLKELWVQDAIEYRRLEQIPPGQISERKFWTAVAFCNC